MIPASERLSESQAPVIQLYNDRLAAATSLQSQDKDATRSARGLNFIALHELLEQVNDIEDYLDLLAELAEPSEIVDCPTRIVTTWSHFVKASRWARSRRMMAMASLPCS